MIASIIYPAFECLGDKKSLYQVLGSACFMDFLLKLGFNLNKQKFSADFALEGSTRCWWSADTISLAR